MHDNGANTFTNLLPKARLLWVAPVETRTYATSLLAGSPSQQGQLKRRSCPRMHQEPMFTDDQAANTP
jgi:hypothetical protein